MVSKVLLHYSLYLITIFLLDFGTVSTMWYFMFFILLQR